MKHKESSWMFIWNIKSLIGFSKKNGGPWTWECPYCCLLLLCPLKTKTKKLYGPFLWMGFNCLKARVTSRRQFTFYHSVPRNSWYSFYRPRKDERLSRPWSHPVVLNTGPLDWKSSTLTTRPLLFVKWGEIAKLMTKKSRHRFKGINAMKKKHQITLMLFILTLIQKDKKYTK